MNKAKQFILGNLKDMGLRAGDNIMLDVIGKRAIKQQSPIIKDNNCLTEKGFWAVYDTTQEEAIESAKQFILDNLKDMGLRAGDNIMLDVIGKRAIKQQSPIIKDKIIKDNLETALQELENDGIIQDNTLTEVGYNKLYN